MTLLWQQHHDMTLRGAFVRACACVAFSSFCVSGAGPTDQFQVAPEEAHLAGSSQDRLARGERAPPTSKQGLNESYPGTYVIRNVGRL